VRASHVRTIASPASCGGLHQMVWYWLPPLLWMAGMWWLSTDMFAAERTGGLLWPMPSILAPRVTYAQYALLHFGIRKAAHVTEYAILALLLLRAWRAGAADAWHWHLALLTLVVVAAHALLDEYHQSFAHYRTASVWDSLLDIVGGLVGLFLCRLRRHRPSQGQ
jgi:VanZ like family